MSSEVIRDGAGWTLNRRCDDENVNVCKPFDMSFRMMRIPLACAEQPRGLS